MEHVSVTIEDGIAVIRLERGKVNAIDERVVEELAGCLQQLAADPQARAVILTGTGKFFSFGFDIPKMLAWPEEVFSDFLSKFTALYRDLFRFPKPVVAALNGHAVAGGCMLALACDTRVMASG